MLDVIFREYDIRGKVGTEVIIDQAYDLARAIAYYFKQRNPAVRAIAVGMDGREHSPILKEKLCAGLIDSGMDVVFIGVCPSPALYFALHTMPVDAGVMITASHNPKEYNGFKICIGHDSVWGKQIAHIRDLFKKRAALPMAHKGTLREQPIVEPYIAWMVEHFPDLVGMQLPVVIDCGNGAAAAVIPGLIKAMRWPYITLLCGTIDGTNPNHEADPTKEANMLDVRAALATGDAVVGIGFDGDADRMAPMTKTGRLVAGDELLALFSEQVLKEFPGTTVVIDIKASSALVELVNRWGGKPVLSPSGHAIIKEHMKKTGARIGGELSCHFNFADHYFGFDDGIYAGLRLLSLLKSTGKTLEELLTIIPKRYGSFEIRMPCPEDKKLEIIATMKEVFAQRPEASLMTLDGVRVEMPYGWGIIRPSNTQPMLSIRFESASPEGLNKIKHDFLQALKPYFDQEFLRKYLEIKEHA